MTQNNVYKHKDNNKISTGILIGFLASVLIVIFLLLVKHLINPLSDQTIVGCDPNKLAVEVNAVNNILTWGSFIVAVLTIVAAVFGVTGFIQLKNNLENQLAQYSSIFEKAENLVNSANGLKQSLEAQHLYIEKSNEFLFQSVFAIANQIPNKDIAKKLLKRQSHIAEIINLYRPCIKPEDIADVRSKKLAALFFIQANGTKDDLPHLLFVSKNDIDEVIRDKALDIYYSIKHRKN